jgi:hypothetical protein
MIENMMKQLDVLEYWKKLIIEQNEHPKPSASIPGENNLKKRIRDAFLSDNEDDDDEEDDDENKREDMKNQDGMNTNLAELPGIEEDHFEDGDYGFDFEEDDDYYTYLESLI